MSDDDGHPTTHTDRLEALASACATGLTGLLGIRLVAAAKGCVRTRLDLRDEHMLLSGAPIHAGTAMSLADTTAGWGCLLSLPDAAQGFATIEGATNFVATARAGATLECVARLLHGGRRTQVWDARVTRTHDNRLVAVYRCTQSLLAQSRLPHAIVPPALRPDEVNR